MNRLVLAAPLMCCVALAACDSSGPQTNAATPPGAAAQPTAAALPFHYEAVGQSSSPSFQVSTSGSYSISYVVKGAADNPGCIVSIATVADDGTAHQVLPGLQLQPTDVKQGSANVDLTAGNWRLQEGGGCSWSVTVAVAA